MNEEKKLEIYLKQLELYRKPKIGVPELLPFLGISRTTFQTIIKKNDLHLLPKFSTKKYSLKNGENRNIYKFDIYDVAKFLAEN